MEQKTTYHLEMASPHALLAPREAAADFSLLKVELACPEYNWFLHEAVGAEFRWGGRGDWGIRQWTEYVGRPELETWVAYVAGTPAGYYELEAQNDGSVRIHCFGLRRQFFGRRLGGVLLAAAVDRCWQMGANRVWLTTCSHDHPHALQNYLARGFVLVDTTSGPANPQQTSALFGGTPGTAPRSTG